MTRPLLAPLCYAKLPRTGLGNMLLVWARACVFAELNGLRLITTGFGSLRVGPFLRFEREKRLYWADFLPSAPADIAQALVLSHLGRIEREPLVRRLSPDELQSVFVYVYEALPDFFLSFAEHRDLVRERLFAMLTPKRKQELGESKPPVIGVHVRRGDFGKLDPNHNLSRSFGPTPLGHFVRLINQIREVVGKNMEVTVFSDGEDDELGPLLALPCVVRAPRRAAIVDLLLLSRAKIVIPSAWSTFSLWSGFLSDAPVFLHPMEHEHLCSIRPANINVCHYEGVAPEAIADWPERLLVELEAIAESTEGAMR